MVEELLEAFSLAKDELRRYCDGALPVMWDLDQPENERLYTEIASTVAHHMFHKRRYPKDEVQVPVTYRATFKPTDDFFQWTTSSRLMELLRDLKKHGYGLADDGTKTINPVVQALWSSQGSQLPKNMLTFFQEGYARFQFWEPPISESVYLARLAQSTHLHYAELLRSPNLRNLRDTLPALLCLTLHAILLTPDKCPHPSLAGSADSGSKWQWQFDLPTTTDPPRKLPLRRWGKWYKFKNPACSLMLDGSVEVPFSHRGGAKPERLYVDLAAISKGEGQFV